MQKLSEKPCSVVPSTGLTVSTRFRSLSLPVRNPFGLVAYRLWSRTRRAESAAASGTEASVTPSSSVTRFDMELSTMWNRPSYSTFATVWLQMSQYSCRRPIASYSTWLIPVAVLHIV